MTSMKESEVPEDWMPPEYRPAEPDVGQWLDFEIGASRDIEEQERRDRSRPGPSRAFAASRVGNCYREQVLKRARIPETKVRTAQDFRVFAWGNDLHDFARRRLDRLGILEEEEIYFHDEERQLTGFVDAVVGGKVRPVRPWRPRRTKAGLWLMGAEARGRVFRRMEKEHQRVEELRTLFAQMFGNEVPRASVEIKTTHSRAMSKAYNAAATSWRYQIQLACYALHLGMDMAHLILLIGRDSVGFLSFQLDPRAVDEAEARLARLRAIWDGGGWPPCTCGTAPGQEWEIKYCSYGGKVAGRLGCCSDSLEPAYFEARNAGTKEEG